MAGKKKPAKTAVQKPFEEQPLRLANGGPLSVKIPSGNPYPEKAHSNEGLAKP